MALDELKSLPVFRWLPAVAAVIAVVTTVVGIWIFLVELMNGFDDLRVEVKNDIDILRVEIRDTAEKERIRDEGWLDTDDEDNALIRDLTREAIAGQGVIMNELAQQTVWLNDLNNYMERSFTQREQRFEELETEHKLLLTQLSDLQYRMGIHKGAHERLDRLLMKLAEE